MFMDSKGLVCAARRDGLQHHKIPFAHDIPFQKDLLGAIRAIKPTALIGVSTIPGAFSPEVLAASSPYLPLD
jgi:malate dehydrogenase (oxaloacetate-decarboxylating)(NADP+)